jgi:hypothetical protein
MHARHWPNKPRAIAHPMQRARGGKHRRVSFTLVAVVVKLLGHCWFGGPSRRRLLLQKIVRIARASRREYLFGREKPAYTLPPGQTPPTRRLDRLFFSATALSAAAAWGRSAPRAMHFTPGGEDPFPPVGKNVSVRVLFQALAEILKYKTHCAKKWCSTQHSIPAAHRC